MKWDITPQSVLIGNKKGEPQEKNDPMRSMTELLSMAFPEECKAAIEELKAYENMSGIMFMFDDGSTSET